MFSMLYNCGPRKTELLSLRIKNIDFDPKNIFILRDKLVKDLVANNTEQQALLKYIFLVSV
jgi:integrase